MSRANPYVRAWRTQRAHRRRTLGLGGWLPGLLAPLLATLVLVPLVRPVFLSFLELPASQWAEGMEGVLLRAGVVLVGWLALDVYTAVIRGPDRDVLALLPVNAAQVVHLELMRVARERWWLLPSLAILLSPVALAGAPALWGAGLIVLVGSWAMGLVVSAAVHLFAVEVAESPRWAPFLDLIRGSNPRPQAAFIYAPGAVLLICGLVVGQGARGAVLAASGELVGWLWMLLPAPLVIGAALNLGPLARRSWFQGSAVLAEIDARYAALADREEALRVYLDWVVRWLPVSVGRYALRDLRHGWRARRTWITGAWLLGVGAFAAGWTASVDGPLRAGIVAVAAIWGVASLGVLLERDEPDFLRAWLPPGGAPALGARGLVLLLWVQPCVWGGALAVGFRRGLAEGALVLAVGAGSGLVAAAVSVACGTLRDRGLLLYAPLAAVLAAATLAAMGGLT